MVSMLTGLAHVEMRVRDLASCRAFYRDALGLTEIAHDQGSDGAPTSLFATGSSFLECHQDPDATTGVSPSGELEDWALVPGSVNHLAFYVDSIEEAYARLKGRAEPFTLKSGPEAMPLGHTYLQRSLLDFTDPSGFVVQIAEVIEPGENMQDRRAEKRDLAAAADSPGLMRGFDHLSIYIIDMPATREFYIEKLGLQEHGERDVSGTDQSVLVVGLTDLEMNRSDAYKDKELGPGIVTSLGFWTDDLEQVRQHLHAKGIQVGEVGSTDARFPGVRKRAFRFLDPDGLPLEIAQRV